jgi:hypothetical protein
MVGVVKSKGKWSVRPSDLAQTFPLQREAMIAAVRLANECGKNGKPSVVLVQQAKNKFETIWTYGTSPYPPSTADLLAASATERNIDR